MKNLTIVRFQIANVRYKVELWKSRNGEILFQSEGKKVAIVPIRQVAVVRF